MKNLLKYILIFLIFSSFSLSQSGMTFQEFSKRLETYFDIELINDLHKKLPQGTNYSIWGWDVGDFSGDGNNDVAFTVKLTTERKRIATVYLFVDMGGYLTEVDEQQYTYVDLPIEIGIIIKNNACYITKKNKLYDWEIKSFRFDNGNLILLDNYTTEKLDGYTYECTDNYHTLQNIEKYISSNKKEPKFIANYMVIPSYGRGREIYKGFSAEAFVDKIDYVSKGAYYWKGKDDASFSIKSAYDDDYLYMTIRVWDDVYIPQNCDSCLGDYIEAWFDITPIKSDSRLLKTSGEKIRFRDNDKDASLYCISIFPGDFLEKKAIVKNVSSTDELESYQKTAVKKIRVVSALKDEGYVVKFRIPFVMFGYESAPVDESKPFEIGCTVVYHDIDNEFRPEEETVISTSVFEPSNPSTYGSLYLIPKEKWYGESENIFTEDILKNLMDLGF